MPNRVNSSPYSLAVTTPATIWPVTLDDLKQHLRFTESDDDSLLYDAIKEATAKLEQDTRRQFVNATVAEYYDEWPLWEWQSMVLHRAPVVSVTSIAYVDLNGDSQTWASTNYNLDTSSEPGRIELAYAKSIPSARYQQNAITVTYVAGYGATRAAQPLLARRGILMYAAAVYDGRCLLPSEQFAWDATVNTLQWSL